MEHETLIPIADIQDLIEAEIEGHINIQIDRRIDRTVSKGIHR